MGAAMAEFRLRLSIVGDCCQDRRLVDALAAFAGYAACDPCAEVEREGYLSAFTFGDEFRQHLTMRGTTKGYSARALRLGRGLTLTATATWKRLHATLRRLCAATAERYGIDGDALLIFFSGSKGFHVGLPSSLWEARPSADFAKAARRFAEQLAAAAGVKIDTAFMTECGRFAPNSRHPKTGLHKRRLEFDELLHVTTAAIVARAAKPEPFELPDFPPTCETAIADWQRAVDAVRQHAVAIRQRRAEGPVTLNRQRRVHSQWRDAGDRPSSSPVMIRLIVPASAGTSASAATIAAIEPFMSTAPRP